MIAAINGVAVAGGLTLALFADIRVAGAGARIGDTSGKAGLLADEGCSLSSWVTRRAIAWSRCRRSMTPSGRGRSGR